jgi:hypothetical protein
VSVEISNINKDQAKFVEDLRAKMVEMDIKVPLRLYDPKKKKEVRIKDTLEPIMSQKGVKFRSDMEDRVFMIKLEKQFLEFPNGKHDDLIDTVEQACTQLDQSLKKTTNAPKLRKYRDPWTGQMKIEKVVQDDDSVFTNQ